MPAVDPAAAHGEDGQYRNFPSVGVPAGVGRPFFLTDASMTLYAERRSFFPSALALAACLGFAAGTLLVPARAVAAEAASHVHAPRSAETARLVAEGEAALAAGEARRALLAFEAAANQEHEADIEMGIVRSLMQLGAYSNAMTFAAHTRGVHPEATEGAALYAWLLAVGGQDALARRVLDEAAARFPQSAAVRAVKAQLATPAPRVPEALRLPPARLAPQPSELPSGTVWAAVGERVAASAVLIDGGRHALTLDAVPADATRVRVRNGLGQTAGAAVVQRLEGLGLLLLRLDERVVLPLAGPGWSVRDPFPGSPAVAVHFLSGDDATAAWPWLRQGFLGQPSGPEGRWRHLGFTLPPGRAGGPVFDAGGRITGIAVDASDGRATMIPVGVLRSALGGLLGEPVAATPAPRLPGQDLYDTALRITLQVLVPQP